jgi:phospholipase C
VGTDTQSYVAGVPQFNTANHQYDTSVFDSLVSAIAHGTMPASSLPAVSFLKAPGYEDGHQGYSDPIDEQQFVTKEINALEQTPDWSSTAVILAYDDSDGFYDHVDAATENGGQPQNASQTSQDFLTGTSCGTNTPTFTNSVGQPEQGRCGYGPRLPLLVISPYAKANYVDNTMTDQSSVTKFIEDNWSLGAIPGSAANAAGTLDNMFNFSGPTQPALFLDPSSGEPTATPTPQLPESSFPAAVFGIGAALVGGVAFWQIRRRRRTVTA